MTRALRLVPMAFVAFAALIVVAGAVVWIAGPARIFGVTAAELYSSIVDEAGSGPPFPDEKQECAHVGGGLWRCEVPDQGDSSRVTYVVRIRHDGCWSARRVSEGGEGPLPRRPSACIGLDDLIRL